ncbi:MAG TPA: 2OG-Fe(II) oxygenase [Anaerolineae bacterium]|nr:2OG-Fe(II) oxygenase [Anaerolineae bacterium]HMR64125.1 2OG-Fe(II) oxygenase [Anaerolineae bacterium]
MTSRVKTVQLASIPLLAAMAGYTYLFVRQQSRYKTLAEHQQALIDRYATGYAFTNIPAESPGFEDRLAVIYGFLPEVTFQSLRRLVSDSANTERTFLPGHKKGGTVSYEELHHLAPQVVAFYHAPGLRQWLSSIIGEPVRPTPLNDQSSCSLLYYTQPGDHIGWHYDHNFYNGRHFTVLLPLINENRTTGQLSSAQLVVQTKDGEQTIATPPNTLVVFEGAKVRHKVTPLQSNEVRVLLSMTFCTSPRASLVKEVGRRFKDTAFFGLRALWT